MPRGSEAVHARRQQIGAMTRALEPVRVLYSFPHKLGASRICYTAWEQLRGIAAAGAQVIVYTGALLREVPQSVEVHTTLSLGNVCLPYRLIGNLRSLALHDWIVSQQLPKHKDRIDIVHVWPSGALRTIQAAKKLGIPTVLERPNADTRFALNAAATERKRIGIETAHYDYRPREANVLLEEAEFETCDYLLYEWTRGELSPVDRAWLSELPYSLVNVGSVGQPRDGHAGAAYVVYDSNSRTVELRRVGYPPPPSGGHGKAKPVPGGGGPPKTISDEIAEHKQRHG